MAETLATTEEIHEVENKIRETGFYNPEIWRRKLMGKWPNPVKVTFTDAEEAMIKEMSNKTGYPRADIVRMAVHDLHFRIMIE